MLRQPRHGGSDDKIENLLLVTAPWENLTVTPSSTTGYGSKFDPKPIPNQPPVPILLGFNPCIQESFEKAQAVSGVNELQWLERRIPLPTSTLSDP